MKKFIGRLRRRFWNWFENVFPAEHRGYIPTGCCPICWKSIMNGSRYEDTYCGKKDLIEKRRENECR